MALTLQESDEQRERLEGQLKDLINELIKDWRVRTKSDLNDDQLAAELKIERASYSKMVNGDPEKMNLPNLQRLIRGLDLSPDDTTRLVLLYGENLFNAQATVEPRLISDRARMMRAISDLRELGNRLLMHPESDKFFHTFTALVFNPTLHAQVRSLIEYSDSLRPLDGIHPPKKSEEEEAREALEKARRERLAQDELPKHKLKSDVDLI
jgi:DNA-binding Xre family transcriptional regulator